MSDWKMGVKGNHRVYYIERLLLLLMNIALYCAADELNYNFTGVELPAAPQNVTAVQVEKDQVLVTWTMPRLHRIQSLGNGHIWQLSGVSNAYVDHSPWYIGCLQGDEYPAKLNAEKEAKSHTVYYAPVENGDQPIEQWKSINVTDSQAVIITGLTRDRTYTIRVSSINPLGQGPMSQPAMITIKVIDDCLHCKSEETTSSVCKCSFEFVEEKCKEVCHFWCRDTQGFDPTNGCLSGCVTGWYGQYCNISCSAMCRECDQVTGQCITCLSNGAGPYCNETCQPGLYGVGCNILCPTLCNRCLNQSYCTECKDGQYGESCQKMCHSDCLTCVDDRHKCTSCKPGKYLHGGNVCLECPDNCVRCTGRDKCLECKSGIYGQKCDMLCPKNCVSCTSSDQCYECVTHRHGERCQCNSNCKNVTGHCDTDEVCQKGCPPYKMGVYCNHSCPVNCYECDQLTGACLKCVSGFYGPECNQPCGRCKRNSKGAIQCDRQTGKCEDCINGWYGWRCNESCSTTCQTTYCERYTGKCDDCMNGWYGLTCDKSCSTKCQGVSCERVTGNCYLCETGYYGLHCTEECSKNCLNVNVIGCDKQTGFCDICVDGFFDNRCNETCSKDCGANPCDKQTGVCQRCQSGFYGEKCGKRCNVNCNASEITKDVCDRDSGYCVQGCKTRWYNEFCQSPCSATCVEDRCHQDTGVCLLGCVTGFAGDTCSLSIHREYLIALDVRQIGAKNVLIQWDKLNLTDIELESVKRVVLNHKMPGSTAVDVHEVSDWTTRTHFLLQDFDLNNKHTFQLVVLFELLSQSPIISKPVELELLIRAPDESMLHLTADVELYDLTTQQEQEPYIYGRYPSYVTRKYCTRVSGESFLNTRLYEKVVTEKTNCIVSGKGEIKITVIKLMKAAGDRNLAVADDKTLTWIMAHF